MSPLTISFQRSDDHLLMNLKGDFDGSSALKLCDILKAAAVMIEGIVVDTDDLDDIYHFGLFIFHREFECLADERTKITFKGVNGHLFGPREDSTGKAG